MKKQVIFSKTYPIAVRKFISKQKLYIRLMTNKLMACYNTEGEHKKAFKKTNVIRVIVGTLFSHFYVFINNEGPFNFEKILTI